MSLVYVMGFENNILHESLGKGTRWKRLLIMQRQLQMGLVGHVSQHAEIRCCKMGGAAEEAYSNNWSNQSV